MRKTPYVDWLFENYPESPHDYQELIEKIGQLFLSFKTKDIVNRLITMNLIIKGPYRVWPYSQDVLAYAHPMADWDLVEYCLKLGSKHKVYSNGTLKRILYDLWSEYVPEVVWQKPKGTPRIPSFA